MTGETVLLRAWLGSFHRPAADEPVLHVSSALDSLMQPDESNASLPARWEDTNLAWMIRGITLAVLLVGSANALSFFVRSRGWGSLLGNREPSDEAIGFPMTVWEEAGGYGSHALKVVPFLVDISVALLLGVVIGLIAISQKSTLNRIMDRFRRQSKQHQVRLQFSLRGLLITTVLAALAAAVARSFTPRIEVLAFIYALGPIALVVFAFIPRRLRWQQRVAILAPAAVMLIAVAIAIGNVLGVEVDKVMMGIFICWTPQSAAAAILISSLLIVKEYRALTANNAGQHPQSDSAGA
jgi:hypothetical protein